MAASCVTTPRGRAVEAAALCWGHHPLQTAAVLFRPGLAVRATGSVQTTLSDGADGSISIPWRMGWQSTPVFLPREFRRQRSLVGYSPWGHTESHTTEQLHCHFHFIFAVPHAFCVSLP